MFGEITTQIHVRKLANIKIYTKWEGNQIPISNEITSQKEKKRITWK